MDNINKNAEGYADPTAAAVLRKETDFGYRPVVYICCPFRDNIEKNMEAARRYCRFAVDRGAIPLAVTLLFPQFMSEETERDLALFMGKALISKCAEIWVFGDRITEGMDSEIRHGCRKNMTVRYFSEEDIR